MAGKVQGVKGTIRTEKSYLLEQRNSACSGDSKKLWNVFNAGLGEDDSDDTDLHTADEFAAFFKDRSILFMLLLTQRLCTTFRLGQHRN